MDAHTLTRSYDRFGGHATISIVGQLIEEHLGSVDHGIDTLETVAFFRTNRGPRRTLESLHREFHSNLAKLPIARWKQKKRRLVIQYESEIGLAEDVFRDYEVDHGLLLLAVDEFGEVLKQLRPKLRKKKGLNIDAFLAGFELLKQTIPGSSRALKEFGELHAAQKREERSKLPWDEQLEIDWTEYHSSAQKLLDDPFYWSATDGRSPHGNDTGADLLASFRAWHRANPKGDCWTFLKKEFTGWGMAEEIDEFRRKQVSEYSPQDEINLVVYDEAVIALAFAEIKLRGKCSSRTADEALTAIDRIENLEVREKFGWPPQDEERSAASHKLKNVLSRYTDA